MRKSMKQRVLCLLLAAMMVLLAAGCGGQDASGDLAGDHSGSSPTAGQPEGGQAIDDVTPSENAAMGRYVEEEVDISEYTNSVLDMQMLSDGSIMILSQYELPIVSKDNGVTWEKKEVQWFKDCFEKSDYIFAEKAASDGTIGVVYSVHGDEEMHGNVVLIKPDGTVIPVEVTLENDEADLNDIWVSDTGRFFVTSYRDRNIYEVKEDGTSEIFLSPQQRADYVRVVGNVAAVDSYANAERVFELHDIETKELIDDEVLQSFLKDYYGERDSNGNYNYSMVYFIGEDNVIYLAGKKGIHRHVIGGSAVEQLVDGGLSRLGSPEYGIVGFIPLNNTEFLALFANLKLIKFTYDPDVPTVPNNRIKIYSLEESSDLRAAISVYQVNNPDMFVEYEVGIEGESSITRDDALKKLNTQIVAGEGPDILCLNGLPVDSYIEKGLLLDVSSLVNDLAKEEKLFENLFHAFERDGGIYAVPGQVAIPLIGGREKDIANMKDLKTIADGVEKLRQDNPGKAIFDWIFPKQFMRAFSLSSAQVWKTDSREFNRDAVEEFLTQIKRMYDAQMDGLNEETIEWWTRINEAFVEERGENWMYNSLYYSTDVIDFMGDYTQIQVGSLTYPYTYYMDLSVTREKGLEDIVFQPISGQSSHVFMPSLLLGINAASPRMEYAQDFLKQFLSKDAQAAMSGFSVNRDALDQQFTPNEDVVGENGEYGSIGTSGRNDEPIGLNIYLPTQEQLDTFYGWMESMDTPYVEDTLLEETVFEEGDKFIQGEQSLDEALNAIEQKMAIYLAE